ncbi:MAG TPA: hypothetical protein PLD84_14180 [Chitinophagales bacterium]|nr:hypothetical protein [Chitinophagales bacterium]
MTGSKKQVKVAELKELQIADVKLLRLTCNRFGKEWKDKKRQLLMAFSTRHIKRVNALMEYHDCLLFLLAYPETNELFELATRELDRIAIISRNIFKGGNEGRRMQLSGSGIAFTPVNVAFGYDLVEWLTRRYPEQVNIFECAADREVVKEMILLLIPKAEQEIFEKKNYSLIKFIQSAKGKSPLTDLQWLIQLIERKNFTPELRDHVYDALKIYVTWLPDQHAPSRTYGRSISTKIFFHRKELKRYVDALKIIREPVTPSLKISVEEKLQLVETARGILAMLQRETDPATYADPAAAEYFEMGRGIDIALYPMVAERRLPFDSYIGYTAFKNRLPIAYGGGWVFQQRCKIGVNVLSPYRGGESAYLFLQVLRLYHHHYKVSRFIIEPYQIGYKNPEGLQSGAFWFYYRMGFVPENAELKALAVDEFNNIKNNKGYRSSLTVLKKLSVSNMELVLDESGHHQVDVLMISNAISKMISNRFEGNRKLAEDVTTAWLLKFLRIKPGGHLSFNVQPSLQNFSLLLQLFPPGGDWSEAAKEALKELIFLKGDGSEWRYIRQFQKLHRLNEAIAMYFQPGKSLK